MRTNCIVKLSKLKIFELNTLVQKETSDHVEGNLLLRTLVLVALLISTVSLLTWTIATLTLCCTLTMRRKRRSDKVNSNLYSIMLIY
jgi:hypothetical protein